MLESAINLNKQERETIERNAIITMKERYQPHQEIEILENELKSLINS